LRFSRRLKNYAAQQIFSTACEEIIVWRRRVSMPDFSLAQRQKQR
jgi:hypothetical protein